MNEERDYNEGKIIYVGSPFQLDFGERDSKKGYYVLDVDNLNYSFIENKISPIHKKLSMNEILSDNSIKEEYKDLITNNFIRIVIDYNLDQKIIDNVIHNLYSLSPSSLIVDPYISQDFTNQEDTDLSGIDITKAIVEFVNLLDINNKEEVIKRTLHLYNQVTHD